MDSLSKRLEHPSKPFQLWPSPSRGQLIGWIGAITVGVVIVAEVALLFTTVPSLVRGKNPDCLLEAAGNEHTTVEEMFQNPAKRNVLRKAVMACSQTPIAM